jgi:hypothetical protein
MAGITSSAAAALVGYRSRSGSAARGPPDRRGRPRELALQVLEVVGRESALRVRLAAELGAHQPARPRAAEVTLGIYAGSSSEDRPRRALDGLVRAADWAPSGATALDAAAAA